MENSRGTESENDVQGSHIDAVTVTTSHSLEGKRRKGVRDALNDTPVTDIRDLTERRITGIIDTAGQTMIVEFHIESTDTALHRCDELPKERRDVVDTLRIKVKKRLSENGLKPETAIDVSKQALQQLEETLQWLSTETLLSLTYHFKPEARVNEYRQESVGGVNLVIFDEKLRVREVPRGKLESTLKIASEFRKEQDW